MIRLYIDEDAMDKDLVRALRARAIDVETANEAGMIRREDHEHLAYATSQGRVLFSFNMGHFCALHADFLASGIDHSGIVVSRQQHYSVGEQMRCLLKLIAGRTADEMHNQLEFLSDWA
jgi:hypothetical protein